MNPDQMQAIQEAMSRRQMGGGQMPTQGDGQPVPTPPQGGGQLATGLSPAGDMGMTGNGQKRASFDEDTKEIAKRLIAQLTKYL